MNVKKFGRKIREKKKIKFFYRLFPDPEELNDEHSIHEILNDLIRTEGGVIDSINLLQSDFLGEGKLYDLISVQLKSFQEEQPNKTFLFLGHFNEGGI